MKLLKDIDVSGKRVFMRGDLDVDVANSSDAVRLEGLKSTVDYLISHTAKQVIIAGHIGRPSHEATDGKPSDRDKLSTKNFIEPLERILGREIVFKANVILGSEATPESSKEDSGQALRLHSGQLKGSELYRTARMTGQGEIILLENLRFWEGEEKNDPEFARQLASLADVYINEAFGVCHRSHASIVGVPVLLPHAAGLHLQEEVEVLSNILKNPDRPLVAIVGGAKIETKLPVIGNLAERADKVIVGGALPLEIGKEAIQLPANVMIATLNAQNKDLDNSSIVQTIELIRSAKTIVWNGNLGLTEEGFDKGSKSVAEAIGESGAYSVVGGGDTTEFLASINLLDKFSFVSSGGGAMLEFLSGKELPGIKALE